MEDKEKNIIKQKIIKGRHLTKLQIETLRRQGKTFFEILCLDVEKYLKWGLKNKTDAAQK